MVSVDVLRLPVDSGIELDGLVETNMREIVNPMSSSIPNRSLFDKLEKGFNNMRLEFFSSNITLHLIMIYCLSRLNSRIGFRLFRVSHHDKSMTLSI